MAAFLTDRLLSPRAASPAAVSFPIVRFNRRHLSELSKRCMGTCTTIWSATCEWLLLLWMLGVVASFFLIAAGAAGLLR
ncbi:MAG: hypothetical protein NVS1B6_02170 [Steroidobacteraceae bacterium]